MINKMNTKFEIRQTKEELMNSNETGVFVAIRNRMGMNPISLEIKALDGERTELRMFALSKWDIKKLAANGYSIIEKDERDEENAIYVLKRNKNHSTARIERKTNKDIESHWTHQFLKIIAEKKAKEGAN